MVWMKSVVPASCGLRFFVVQEIMLFDLLQAGFPM
jgi:hypothetical protein